MQKQKQIEMLEKENKELIGEVQEKTIENTYLREEIKIINTRNSRQRIELKNLLKTNEEHRKLNGELRQDNYKLDKENQMLFEENLELKKLCDKYEEEHKTTFEEWQNGISKYKTLKELQDRIDKAIEYIKNNSLFKEKYDYDNEENIYLSGIDDEQARIDLLRMLGEIDVED